MTSVESKKINIYSVEGTKVGEKELNPNVFNVPVKESIVHEVATSMLANARLGLAHTKTKGEVRGGGKKPWRQKGTGRSRHGSIRSPLWKGGGVIFGPRNDRNYKKKINKQVKRKAICMCLSDRVQDNQLLLLDKIVLSAAKTKDMHLLLKNLFNKIYQIDFKKTRAKLSVLVAGNAEEKDFDRLVRNIPGVKFLFAKDLNVIDILMHKYIILDEKGLEMLEKTFNRA